MQSLNHVLNRLKSQILTPEQQQFQMLCNCWPEVVGNPAAQYTRPIAIHRGVLQVATASSTWSQDLTLRRMQILHKLNQRLLSPLQEIRFATGQWREKPHRDQQMLPDSPPDEIEQLWEQHPSRISIGYRINHSLKLDPPGSASAVNTFQQWAETIKERSQHLPICPQCNCPTPAGELERWSVCGLCAIKDWH